MPLHHLPISPRICLYLRAGLLAAPAAVEQADRAHLSSHQQSLERVGASHIPIASVATGFPAGQTPLKDRISEIKQAVEYGATEIDMVIPYAEMLEGREETVITRVKRVRDAADGRRVKAILETGVLEKQDVIRRAAELAIEGGADFIKTSTGKVPVNATLDAARTMLEVIAGADRPVGFKPAGGVKTTAQAGHYLALADEIMGEGWATLATFRFGASGVLDALLASIEGRKAEAKAGY